MSFMYVLFCSEFNELKYQLSIHENKLKKLGGRNIFFVKRGAQVQKFWKTLM